MLLFCESHYWLTSCTCNYTWILFLLQGFSVCSNQWRYCWMSALHLSSKTPVHGSVDKIICNSVLNIMIIIILLQSYLDVDQQSNYDSFSTLILVINCWRGKVRKGDEGPLILSGKPRNWFAKSPKPEPHDRNMWLLCMSIYNTTCIYN